MYNVDKIKTKNTLLLSVNLRGGGEGVRGEFAADIVSCFSEYVVDGVATLIVSFVFLKLLLLLLLLLL